MAHGEPLRSAKSFAFKAVQPLSSLADKSKRCSMLKRIGKNAFLCRLTPFAEEQVFLDADDRRSYRSGVLPSSVRLLHGAIPAWCLA